MTSAKFVAIVLVVMIVIGGFQRALADTFGSAANTFNMAFVTIGNPSNPADTTGKPNPAGSVLRPYRIGKYEVSQDMISKANLDSAFGILHRVCCADFMGPNKPVIAVSWFEAAEFVNWLNTSSGSPPAYKFDAGTFALWQPSDAGYDPTNLFRNSLAKYFLPSVDEWYKAAYYDPITASYFKYATGSDTIPTAVASGSAPGTAVWGDVFGWSYATFADVDQAGGLSPYGTMGQNGNVPEWEETEQDLLNDSSLSNSIAIRAFRGGSLFGQSHLMEADDRRFDLPTSASAGFRVASVVPEPNTIVLAALAFGLLIYRRRATR
jgi:formylglycine-generating enzyme required for sulfatase activity